MEVEFVRFKRYFNYNNMSATMMMAPLTYAEETDNKTIIKDVEMDNLEKVDDLAKSYRKCFIGENISDFVYFDIEDYMYHPEKRGTVNFAFDGGKDCPPYFFYAYIYDLLSNKDGHVIKKRVNEFIKLQKKYKALLEDVLKNGKDNYKTKDKEEKEYYYEIVKGKMPEWYEFLDIETALDFEFKCLVNTGVSVFRCEHCGRVSTGTERASCCNQEIRYIVREDEHEEYGSYLWGIPLTCKRAYKDQRYRNKESVFDVAYNKCKDKMRTYWRRSDGEKREDYDELLKHLNELREDYQEDYDAEDDLEIKDDILNEYKTMFEILRLPPKENGEYIQWDEWLKTFYQYIK